MKVLFLIHNLYIGGVPKALLSLLGVMDKDKYDIDIFCPAQKDGTYVKEFSQYNLFKQDFILDALTRYRKNLRFSFFTIAVYLIKILRYVLMNVGCDLYKWRLLRIANNFSNKYDVVVAYSEGDMTEMGANIDAPLKIAWVHMDYKRVQVYNKNMDERCIYEKYNKIIIPSHFSAKNFSEVYPDLSNRVRVFPNVLNVNEILQKSQENEDLDNRFNNEKFTIISVGRICGEKQFYQIPIIAKQINSKNFIWYIIGQGNPAEVTCLLEMIDSNNMGEQVKYLGPKKNPYPYMKKSNLLVSLSISETFSYVINEAKVLGIPVITTPFGSSDDVMSTRDKIVPLSGVSQEINKLIENSVYYENYKAISSGKDVVCRAYNVDSIFSISCD